MPLGLFLGGCIVAIPVVTGVAEGVSEQKKQNEEANNETRMIKFNLEAFCGAGSPSIQQIHGTIVVLRHNKVITPAIGVSKIMFPSTLFFDHQDVHMLQDAFWMARD
jgi:hypothetical protein